MQFKIGEIEFNIKSRQAIEILDLVDKSGLLQKAKELAGTKPDQLGFFPELTLSYKVAHAIVAIAAGSFSNGTMTPNTNVADDMPALQLPMIAVQIVKSLTLPVSYVITSSDEIDAAKKNGESVEEKSGKPEKLPGPVA